jgi:hypothetical protein
MNTISRSLLFLAGDEDFIGQRDREALEQPDNVLEGLASGLKSTLTGVASGVTGIYQQPVKGAKKSGVKGFMKGTLKGLGGAVVKPVSGGLDLLGKTAQGVHNMVKVGGRGKKKAAEQTEEVGTGMDERNDGERKSAHGLANSQRTTTGGQELSKIRALRPFYGRNHRLKPYHDFQAHVAADLKLICKGDYSQDHFLDALGYANEEVALCLILTEERILIVDAETKAVVKDLLTTVLFRVDSKAIPAMPQQLEEGSSLVAPQQQQETIYQLVIRLK